MKKAMVLFIVILSSLQNCFTQNDYENYAKYLKAAQNGEAWAQYEIGECYLRGKGVEEIPSKACEWFQKAANQGYAKAQYRLGYCYRWGKGVSEDSKMAFEWFQKAAIQGYAEAQYVLGKDCYDNGCGTPQNKELAFSWLLQAARQNHRRATHIVARKYFKGDGVSQDYNKSLEWFTKMANNGDCHAAFLLASWFYDSTCVFQNYSKAFYWYQKAVVNDDYIQCLDCYYWAQHHLAEAYFYGRGTQQNYFKAVEWYKKVCLCKYNYKCVKQSAYMVGLCYENGFGVEKSSSIAIEWYKKAGDYGKDALNRLNYNFNQSNISNNTYVLEFNEYYDNDRSQHINTPVKISLDFSNNKIVIEYGGRIYTKNIISIGNKLNSYYLCYFTNTKDEYFCATGAAGICHLKINNINMGLWKDNDEKMTSKIKAIAQKIQQIYDSLE